MDLPLVEEDVLSWAEEGDEVLPLVGEDDQDRQDDDQGRQEDVVEAIMLTTKTKYKIPNKQENTPTVIMCLHP